MSTITIADHQTDVILDDITSDFYWDDKHSKNLRDNKETFDFTTFADKRFSEFLSERNRIIIPDEDGELIELFITNTRKYRQTNGSLFCDVRTSASFIDLKQAKIIRPHVTSALSAEAHAREALNGTEYEIGTVDFKGVRTFTFEERTNPYSYLHRIASEFGLELHFRVESDGNKITRRYVDLIERVGSWNGREATFGRDLEGIERIEDFSHIVTALIGIGPEREDGTRLEVLVENEEALQRWGRNNQHRIEIYEPMSDDPDMTESRLRTLTENELEKRINSQVQYIANIVDLANVVGLEHEIMRFGDTIRIKDLKFNPPLYLEARIHTVERSIKNLTRKTVVLGDYIEYTEEDVMALIRTLQKEVNKKIGLGTLSEVTYTKPEIDEKDERGNQAADKIETDVGWVTPIESTTGAQEKANQAKDDANEYTDGIKQQIDTELLEKTDYEYVDGQLQLKADSETVQAINNTVEGLEQTANGLLQSVADNSDELEAQGGRITTVETDLDEVEGQLSLALTDLSTLAGTVSQQGTQISANTEAIGLKASQSDLDTLSGDVSDISGQLTVMAGEIEAKADRQALETIEGNVTTISNDLASLSVAYDGITADISSLETTTDGLSTDITNLNTDIQAVAGEVSTKVSAEYVTGAIADIEIGGRNLLHGTAIDDFIIYGNGVNISRTNTKPTKTIRIEYTNAGATGGLIQSNEYRSVILQEGQVYTLSFDVRGSLDNLNYVYLMNNDTSNQAIGSQTIQSNTEFNRITFTFTKLYDSSSSYVMISSRGVAEVGDWFEVKNIKLEKGNKATDWTPAPEDVQAEIDSVYEYASSEFSQLPGKLALKADASVVDGIESRVTTAELNIDALDGAITSKVSEGDVRSIFTQEAGSFTFDADQINFNGHVFGQNATFEGRIEGAEIVGSTFNQSGSKGSITLDQEGLKIRDASNSLRMILSTTNGSFQTFSPSSIIFEPNDNFYELVAGTGLSGLGDGFFGFENSAPNRTLNMYNEGNGSSIQFFSPQINIGGRLVIGGGLVGQGKVARLEFNTNRSSVSSIYWNASTSTDYGMFFNVDGNFAGRIASNGNWEAERNFVAGNNLIHSAGSSMNIGADSLVRITSKGGFNGSDTVYRPLYASEFNPVSLAKYKENIEKWSGNGLDIVNRADVHSYNLKDDKDKQQKYGFVIGEGYNLPDEIVAGTGEAIDLYNAISIAYKAIQELSNITTENVDDINFLKMKNQYLRGVIEQLREESE